MASEPKGRPMRNAFIEHVNLTVSDPERSAKLFHDLFGWRVRWQGPARDRGRSLHVGGGRPIHVGDDEAYLAVYAAPEPQPGSGLAWPKGAPLNHVGIQVEDLDETERRVIAA